MAIYQNPVLRFFKKVEMRDGCLEWTGYRDKDGYGTYSPHAYGVKKNPERAHRYIYELVKGPIPDGLVVHHRCENKSCVRLDHLEVVTHRENLLRSDTPSRRNLMKTHCPKGHPLYGDNLYVRKDGRVSRGCRSCLREANRRGNLRRRMQQGGVS